MAVEAGYKTDPNGGFQSEVSSCIENEKKRKKKEKGKLEEQNPKESNERENKERKKNICVFPLPGGRLAILMWSLPVKRNYAVG